MIVTIKIEITKEYKLQISTINKEGKETNIEEVIPSIRFNRNTINVCSDGEKNNSFYSTLD